MEPSNCARNATASDSTSRLIEPGDIDSDRPVDEPSSAPANANSGINAGAVLKQALAEAGGRGGGTAELAQGGVADEAKLSLVATSVRNRILGE